MEAVCAHLAALLELLSGDPRIRWDATSIQAALAWEPKDTTAGFGEALIGLCTIVVAAVAILFSLHGRAAAITYPADDAVYPGGVKRDRAAIVRFMESEVMPWARDALGPIKGGRDAVTCATCHGADAESRSWQMPAVVALPQPAVVARGWEVYGGRMDAQMRNAIYGYIAESDNQAKAAYMREIVMPGMAGLLRRPPYDFTRPYDYNRSHSAFGCYHCHRVK
jgi:cytochrome c553